MKACMPGFTGERQEKHHSDKIMVENPGRFSEGITEKNIIMHPSVPGNKLIAKTLQSFTKQQTGFVIDKMRKKTYL